MNALVQGESTGQPQSVLPPPGMVVGARCILTSCICVTVPFSSLRCPAGYFGPRCLQTEPLRLKMPNPYKSMSTPSLAQLPLTPVAPPPPAPQGRPACLRAAYHPASSSRLVHCSNPCSLVLLLLLPPSLLLLSLRTVSPPLSSSPCRLFPSHQVPK